MSVNREELRKKLEENYRRGLWYADKYCCDEFKSFVISRYIAKPYKKFVMGVRQRNIFSSPIKEIELNYCPFCGKKLEGQTRKRG